MKKYSLINVIKGAKNIINRRCLSASGFFTSSVGATTSLILMLMFGAFVCNNAFGTHYSITYNDGVVSNMPVDISGETIEDSVQLSSNVPITAERRFLGWCLGTSNSSNITTTNGIDSCSGASYLAGASLPINTGGNNYLYTMWSDYVEVEFVFDVGVESVVVDGNAITQSGTTKVFLVNSVHKIQVNYNFNEYEANDISITSGDAMISGNDLFVGGSNSTINVTSKRKSVITFDFDANVTSVVVDGNTITQSGDTLSLLPNRAYPLQISYASGYSLDTIVVSSGDAEINGVTLTVGDSDSVISITSQPEVKVDVTFTFTNITSITADGQMVSTSGNSISLTSWATYTVTVTPGSNYTFSTATIASGTGYSISNIDTANNTFDLTVGSDAGTVNVAGAQCITADTLITLADGSKKRAADLTGEEELLVWDFDTASYAAAPIVFIEPEPEAEYNIIHLFFEDESDVEISYEHGFFDYTLGKFVYINNDNPEQYIDHEFIMQDRDTYKTVRLTDIKFETKLTTLYGLTTYKHFNFFNNDMLSIEGNITGMFNYFEVDKDTMGYDQAKKQADIEKYGLLTYEDFNGMIDELGFEAYNGQYLAVSIGKGLTTWERIKALADYYGHFTEEQSMGQANRNNLELNVDNKIFQNANELWQGSRATRKIAERGIR